MWISLLGLMAAAGRRWRWVGPKKNSCEFNNKIFSLQLALAVFPQFPNGPVTKKKTLKKKMASPSQIRSLYRSIVREIPHRPLSTPPSQIQQRIRNSFTFPAPAPDGSNNNNHHHTTNTTTNTNTTVVTQQQKFAEGEEYLRYAKAQRMYTLLLERYNPGIGSMMEEDERTRLTARRVGINLPEEYDDNSTSSR